MRNVLVTGFGAFLDVDDNPSGRVARAVDGAEIEGLRIVGVTLPVRYQEGPRQAVALALELDARVVIGLGVDRSTRTVDVETRAWNRTQGLDVAGEQPFELEPGGPDTVGANIDAAAFAEALGGRVDDDAGRYVCNAWLYQVARALTPERRVVFVHVPSEGLDPDVLLRAIGSVFGDPRS
jgi:pyroglutamyl-peptidase